MRRNFPRAGGIALLLAALAGAAPARPQPPAAERELAELSALEARLAGIGQRLAVASLDLCGEQEWRPGLVVLDLGQVAPRFRAAATRLFGPGPGLAVAALAAGGPAQRAGLIAGDVILALDGRPAGLEALDAAFEDGRAIVEIRRGGARSAIAVAAERGCASRFELIREGGREGHADGRRVQISIGLARYAADDAELAAAVAHEFAHNILRHRARLRASRRLSIRDTEIEADRLSVYLMERAGYDPEGAVRFWTRFGPHPLNFLRGGAHPPWRSRVELLRAEIAAIRRARAAGQAPMPAFARLPMPAGG